MNYKISPLALIAALIAPISIGAISLPAHSQTDGQTDSQTDATQNSASCPAALDRMRNHTVTSSDSLASVASAYRLSPETLTRFNPGVGISPGATLVIPPFNGSVVTVAAGESWQSLAKQYGSRADVLFEVNGCVADVPSRIFVPSAPGAAGAIASLPSADLTMVYPLAEFATIVRGYGWQPHATRDELVFNSGIAFSISEPNQVLAAAQGTVAFAGAQEGYGQLVVINHGQGLQTRYANLGNVSVSVGQSVATGAAVGSIGEEGDATFLYFEVRTNSPSGWIAQDPGKYVPDLGLL
jgi:murein DD-endopeptidase MepM/ murein hydrolase activator NlpD